MKKILTLLLILPVLSLTLSFHLVEIKKEVIQEGWHCGMTLCLCEGHDHGHHEVDNPSHEENVYHQWDMSTPVHHLELIEKRQDHSESRLKGKPLIKFAQFAHDLTINETSDSFYPLTETIPFKLLDYSLLKPPQNLITF